VGVLLDGSGVTFCAQDLGALFLDSLDAHYTRALRERAEWLTEFLSQHPLEYISELVENSLAGWGSEFEREAIFQEARL
jgi:hypothetical protein